MTETDLRKEAVRMAAILGSIATNLLKVIILAAVAVAGVICGKKFRDRRDADKAAQNKAAGEQPEK